MKLKTSLLLLGIGLFCLATAAAQGQDVKVVEKLNLRQLKSHIDKASNKQMMPVDVRISYKGNNKRPTFSLSLAKAEEGKIWVAKTELDDDQFWEQHEAARPAHLRLVCHREYKAKKKNKHICIWQFDETYGPIPDYGFFSKDPQPNLGNRKPIWNSASEIPVTGPPAPAFAKMDEMLVSMVRVNQLPGVSVAVMFKNKIVYKRGVGYSNIDAMVPMKPSQPIRLLQCCRPLTSVAITQLIEQKKIDFETRVFEYLEIDLPSDADPNMEKITIRHLLNDSGGFDHKATFDAIRRPEQVARLIDKKEKPVTEKQIIDVVIKQSLGFKPGTRQRISNFGFFLLGKVIEKASGTNYEDYIEERVLRPLQLDSFSPAQSRVEERPRNETSYYQMNNWFDYMKLDLDDYGKWTPGADAVNMKLLRSSGGYIGNPSDFLRFLAGVCGPRSPVLSPSSAEMVFAVPDYAKGAKEYVAAGWNFSSGRKKATFGTGAMTGTCSKFKYYQDGSGWVISTNILRGANKNLFFNIVRDNKFEDRFKEGIDKLK